MNDKTNENNYFNQMAELMKDPDPEKIKDFMNYALEELKNSFGEFEKSIHKIDSDEEDVQDGAELPIDAEKQLDYLRNLQSSIAGFGGLSREDVELMIERKISEVSENVDKKLRKIGTIMLNHKEQLDQIKVALDKLSSK